MKKISLELSECKSHIGSSETEAQGGDRVQCGVGMQVVLSDDNLIRIMFINPGGAAHECGKLSVGDIVYRVDGKPMRSTDDIFEAILGWSGSTVVLDVETSEGRGEISLVRKVAPTTISAGVVPPPGTAGGGAAAKDFRSLRRSSSVRSNQDVTLSQFSNQYGSFSAQGDGLP